MRPSNKCLSLPAESSGQPLSTKELLFQRTSLIPRTDSQPQGRSFLLLTPAPGDSLPSLVSSDSALMCTQMHTHELNKIKKNPHHITCETHHLEKSPTTYRDSAYPPIKYSEQHPPQMCSLEAVHCLLLFFWLL